MRARLSRHAARQAREAAIAFQSRDPSSVERFRTRLRLVVSSLEEYPTLGRQISDDGVRRFPLRPFPYSIVYKVTGDEVVVLAVPHDRQSPSSWLES